jgi:hypothetical protein
MRDMGTRAPVVLLIYRRPALTARVMEAIAAAEPRMLFVAADGPRGPEEADLCEEARACVLDRVDWSCDVLTRFSYQNLGPRYGPARALDWVFSRVEEAVVLEDDCLPGASFFRFCDELLDRFRYDDRIMEIGGANYQCGASRTRHSYYFSKFAHTNGWATWRRCWSGFDVEIRDWPQLREAGLIESWCETPHEQRYWTRVFDAVYTGEMPTSWDYQWMLFRWSRSGLCAVPERNLVSNIGFGPGATHTTRRVASAEIPLEELGPVHHADHVFRSHRADRFMFEHHFGGRYMRWPWRPLRVAARLARRALAGRGHALVHPRSASPEHRGE